MNWKITKAKMIVTSIAGILMFALAAVLFGKGEHVDKINGSYSTYGPDYLMAFLALVIFSALTYIIWSLAQKKA